MPALLTVAFFFDPLIKRLVQTRLAALFRARLLRIRALGHGVSRFNHHSGCQLGKIAKCAPVDSGASAA